MESSIKVREIFKEYSGTVETSLKEVLNQQSDLSMYKHMQYFMGFLGEELQPFESYGGKRFRSGLCLMLADWYGEKEAGVSVATSIELFHNFTLIHDDIVDGDTLRRGRPTVWKLFGTDHAINSGDGQLILSLQTILRSDALSAQQKVAAQAFLTQQYLKVVEGQYLDFSLTDAKLGDHEVTKEAYLEMVGRKTADLIAAATKSAGIVSGKGSGEQETLFEYGYNFGVAYQLCDDVVSIWGSMEQTGKRLHGDILEKKKTLPILHLLEISSEEVQKKVLDLYNSDNDILKEDAKDIVKLLDSADVYAYMSSEIKEKADLAKHSAEKLSLTDQQKQVLKNIVDELLPDIKNI